MRIRDDFGKETVIAAATLYTKILQVSDQYWTFIGYLYLYWTTKNPDQTLSSLKNAFLNKLFNKKHLKNCNEKSRVNAFFSYWTFSILSCFFNSLSSIYGKWLQRKRRGFSKAVVQKVSVFEDNISIYASEEMSLLKPELIFLDT